MHHHKMVFKEIGKGYENGDGRRRIDYFSMILASITTPMIRQLPFMGIMG